MSLRNALLIACLLVFPGVLLRVAPYMDRVTGISGRQATAVRNAEEPRRSPGLPAVRSRLSERPLVLVALGFAVEVGIYVILVTVLLRSLLVRRLEAFTPAAKFAGFAFIAVLFCGFLGGAEETFPFVPWRMYSGQPEGSPSVCLLEGRARSGAEIRFKPSEVLPVLKRHRAYALLDRRARAVDEAEGDGQDAKTELSIALLALARLYNHEHATDPLERLSVSIGTIGLDSTSPPWVHDARLIAAVDVE